MNRSTQFRRSQKHQNKVRNNAKKLGSVAKRSGFRKNEMYMVEWLKEFAKMVGDQLPFGDFVGQEEIRLPHGSKRLVYESFVKFCQADPSTHVDKVMDYETFAVWKKRRDVKHIKCSKFKLGFSRCDKCYEFETQLSKHLDVLQKERVKREFDAHIEEERMERAQYYKARVKATLHPEKYLSIILDAMDQKMTCVQYFGRAPKSFGTDYFVKVHAILFVRNICRCAPFFYCK